MRLGVVIITSLIIGLFSCSGALCKEKKEKPSEKPAVVVSVEKIVRGKTFTDRKAENVSFTLKPTKAFFQISF